MGNARAFVPFVTLVRTLKGGMPESSVLSRSENFNVQVEGDFPLDCGVLPQSECSKAESFEGSSRNDLALLFNRENRSSFPTTNLIIQKNHCRVTPTGLRCQ